MGDSPVIFSCVVEQGGVKHLCEVYESWAGDVEDFAVYVLDQDGKKGESIIEDGFEAEVQARFSDWLLADIDNSETDRT